MPKFTFRSFLTLIRITVSAAVTYSAFVALFCFSRKITSGDLIALTAIFLLAAGTSVLNQFQERETDALMKRTKTRPLPAGEMKPVRALLIAALLILSGMILFGILSLWITMILGVVNILLYNGIYTPLKKKTTFSLIFGALTGAVPVLMGWTAAGGNILDPVALFLSLFIFFWQIPHFWLLMLTCSTDYKAAGIPAITDNLNLNQVKRLILIWLTAASLTSLLIIINGFSQPYIYGIPLLIFNLVLLVITGYRFFIARADSFRFLFILVNTFLFAMLSLMVIEKINFWLIP